MEVPKEKFSVALSLLLMFAFLSAQVLVVCSADLSAKVENVALSVISNVIGLDMTKYTAELYSHSADSLEGFGGLVLERVAYLLKADKSQILVICTFLNYTLVSWELSPYGSSEFSPLYAQPLPTKALDLVKGTLQRCHAYSKSSIAQEALSILDTITEIKTMNVTRGNLKMRVMGDYIIDWVRIVNGLEFPTGLSINLNNGVVDMFSDQSSFYRIGSVEVKISREEATRIALEKAKTYTEVTIWLGDRWETFPFKVKEQPLTVELRLCFINLTMYPSWYVWFVADPQVYTVTGYEAYVRADTGEAVINQTTHSYGAPHIAENPQATAQGSSDTTPTETPPNTAYASENNTNTNSPMNTYSIAAIVSIAAATALAAVVLKKRSK